MSTVQPEVWLKAQSKEQLYTLLTQAGVCAQAGGEFVAIPPCGFLEVGEIDGVAGYHANVVIPTDWDDQRSVLGAITIEEPTYPEVVFA